MSNRALLLVLMSLAGFAQPVGAQVNLVDEPLGALYLSPYPDRYSGVIDGNLMTFGVPFKVYLVADIDFGDIGAAEQNASNGLSAWEASVQFPAGLTVLAIQRFPDTSINFGTAEQNTLNYLVGLGSTVPAGGPVVLLEFLVLALRYFPDEWIRLGPVTTTPSVVDAPAWLEAVPASGCVVNEQPTPCLYRFGEIRDVRISFGLPAEATSFGAMKARYE